jgi:hypothetical protein
VVREFRALKIANPRKVATLGGSLTTGRQKDVCRVLSKWREVVEDSVAPDSCTADLVAFLQRENARCPKDADSHTKLSHVGAVTRNARQRPDRFHARRRAAPLHFLQGTIWRRRVTNLGQWLRASFINSSAQKIQ